jgi:N-acetylmuramoyl-L-alanine amidase
VVGHRDLSPDKNYNGIVDPWERTKECPCFEVKAEAWE